MFAKRKKSTRQAGLWQSQLLRGAEKIEDHRPDGSLWFFRGLLWLFVGVLGLRVFELQVVQGNYHRERAEENRLVTRRLAASRGLIRDRNGEVLTRNIPTYKKLVTGTTLFQGQFEPLTRDEALGLTNVGEWVFFDISRDYLLGRVMAPVVGYVAEATRQDLEQLGTDFVAGDLVGKTGVEKSFEQRLRGQPGYEYVEVNSKGETIRSEGSVEPVNGQDVVLTVDRILSQDLYEAMEGFIGAGVAVDPKTGEVLALVNRPSFDPNNVANSLSEEDMPFFNRAIGGGYPPGSIYKLVTLTAALEEGAITADETIEDTGEIVVNGFRFGNWLYDRTGGTEGSVNAVMALQRSNDIYFYRIGEKLGVDKLAEWSKYFGLGSLTGINIPGEIPGIVPTPLWKERETGVRWYLGNTYHMSIGQGDLHTTPLQMAMATSVIASGGKWCRPQIVKDGSEPECRELGITLPHLETVEAGMVAVCQPGGTASRWAQFPTTVACKTGTAQFGTNDKTHAWFTVYAPLENPEVVLTILLEGAGEGSEFASPVALEVMEKWWARHE